MCQNQELHLQFYFSLSLDIYFLTIVLKAENMKHISSYIHISHYLDIKVVSPLSLIPKSLHT